MPRKPEATPRAVDTYLADICDRIAGGQSLRSICVDLDIKESTVRTWLARDAEAHEQFLRSRELGCDALADQVIEIADTLLIGQTVTRKPIVVDGKHVEGAFTEEVKTEDMLGHRRLQIDSRLRLMGKWSQRYGEKVQHTGADGGPIVTENKTTIDASALTDEQLRVLASIRVPAS